MFYYKKSTLSCILLSIIGNFHNGNFDPAPMALIMLTLSDPQVLVARYFLKN